MCVLMTLCLSSTVNCICCSILGSSALCDGPTLTDTPAPVLVLTIGRCLWPLEHPGAALTAWAAVSIPAPLTTDSQLSGLSSGSNLKTGKVSEREVQTYPGDINALHGQFKLFVTWTCFGGKFNLHRECEIRMDWGDAHLSGYSDIVSSFTLTAFSKHNYLFCVLR